MNNYGFYISSATYDGQYCLATYLDSTTNTTIDLGVKQIPFQYFPIDGTPQGKVFIYFSGNDQTCVINITEPNPTPTPTSHTPTPTPSVTVTPTVTSSKTPTPTPTSSVTPTHTPTHTPTPTITPTPSPTPRAAVPFSFDFDYMLCEYFFTDGTDMDTVTYMTVPSIMETTSSDPNPHIGPVNSKYYNYVGTCNVSSSGPQFPLSPSTPFLTYGGDNRSANGTESVLFNLLEFKIQHSGVTNIQFAFTADWYGSVGNNPVTMKATLWKGGTPIYFDDPDYTWTNPTATGTYSVNSSGQVITLNVQDCEPYELVSNLQYNLTTYQGQFI